MKYDSPRSQEGFCGSEPPQIGFYKAWHLEKSYFEKSKFARKGHGEAVNGGVWGGSAPPSGPPLLSTNAGVVVRQSEGAERL